jgi:DNA-binding transcriptional ArsR family regulator
MARVMTIDTTEGLNALSHPTRIAILGALSDRDESEPASAADLARLLGQPRQKVNYHLKALKEAQLVVAIDSRQKGNFIETRYAASARSFLVAPEVAWSDGRRLEAMRTAHSLETLVEEGARLQRDAIELLDRATFDGEDIASASVSATLRFASGGDRAAFMREYLEVTKKLLDRYGSSTGDSYRVFLSTYPQSQGE